MSAIRTYEMVVTDLNAARQIGTEPSTDSLDVDRVAGLFTELGQKLATNCETDEQVIGTIALLNEDFGLIIRDDMEFDALANRVYQARIVNELAEEKARLSAENNNVQTEVSNQDDNFSKIESLFWQYELILMQHGNSAFATAGVPNENFKAFRAQLSKVVLEYAAGDPVLHRQLNKAVEARMDWTSVWYSQIEQSWKSNAQAVNAETAATTTPAGVEIAALVSETVAGTQTVEVEQAPAVILRADEAKPSVSAVDTEPALSPKELQPMYEAQLREWADQNRDKVDTIDKLGLLFNKQKRASIKQGWTRKEYTESSVADAIFGIMSEELWARTGAKTGETDAFNAELPVLRRKVYEKPSNADQLLTSGKKVHKYVQRIGYRALDMGQNFIQSRRKPKK